MYGVGTDPIQRVRGVVLLAKQKASDGGRARQGTHDSGVDWVWARYQQWNAQNLRILQKNIILRYSPLN